jgi:4-carboxymuconolactone decarboxylase
MMRDVTPGATLSHLDDATRALVRLAAALTSGSEGTVRSHLLESSKVASPIWIEELLLQTYLFAGFPRALNGMREWRRLHKSAASPARSLSDSDARRHGEETCARVYGSMYDRLRVNIRELHPLLDEWMILEGYGKVLSRPELDLPRRELCIVAACAAAGQDRQLQSHLHGALNAGVEPAVVSGALQSLEDVISADLVNRATSLWQRIRNDVH